MSFLSAHPFHTFHIEIYALGDRAVLHRYEFFACVAFLGDVCVNYGPVSWIARVKIGSRSRSRVGVGSGSLKGDRDRAEHQTDPTDCQLWSYALATTAEGLWLAVPGSGPP